MLDTKHSDENAAASALRVWSKRKQNWVSVSAEKSVEAVDELLRTGVGTRMLVPDWDAPEKDEGTRSD